MAKDNFDAVMVEVKRHEGGYVDHPKDPGGATNMGITFATLKAWRGKPITKQDVKDLTWAEAKQIYRARYWNPIQGDLLPYGVDLATMDPAVNSGVSRGAKWLQAAVGVTQDGKVGKQTLTAANSKDPATIVRAICSRRLGWLKGLKTWTTFGRGWSRRVAEVEAKGVSMALTVSDTAQAAYTKLLQQSGLAYDKAKKDNAAAGTAGVGTAGAGTSQQTGLSDLAAIPEWAWIVIAGVLIVVAVNYLGRARINAERGRAYDNEALEV